MFITRLFNYEQIYHCYKGLKWGPGLKVFHSILAFGWVPKILFILPSSSLVNFLDTSTPLRHFNTCSAFLAPKRQVDVYLNFMTHAIAKEAKSQLSYFSAIYLSCLRTLSVFSLSKPLNQLNYAIYLVQAPVFYSVNLPLAYLLSKYFPVK